MAKGGSATGPKRVRFDAHKIAKKLKQHKKLSNIGSPSAGFLEHELEGGTNNAGRKHSAAAKGTGALGGVGPPDAAGTGAGEWIFANVLPFLTAAPVDELEALAERAIVMTWHIRIGFLDYSGVTAWVEALAERAGCAVQAPPPRDAAADNEAPTEVPKPPKKKKKKKTQPPAAPMPADDAPTRRRRAELVNAFKVGRDKPLVQCGLKRAEGWPLPFRNGE